MRKKTVKSNYRPPNRSERILAIIGILVVGSLLFTALAPNFVTVVSPPTVPGITAITLIVSTPTSTATATPVATSGTPATATPGQAPPPAATP